MSKEKKSRILNFVKSPKIRNSGKFKDGILPNLQYFASYRNMILLTQLTYFCKKKKALMFVLFQAKDMTYISSMCSKMTCFFFVDNVVGYEDLNTYILSIVLYIHTTVIHATKLTRLWPSMIMIIYLYIIIFTRFILYTHAKITDLNLIRNC